MLYNNPHAQLLLPSWPAQAADSDSAVAARRGEYQFAGVWFLHLLLHLLLCSTRQPFSLLHAPGCPRRVAGSAEWPISQLQPACSGGGRAAGTTADSHLHPRLHCLVTALALPDGSLHALKRTWLEDACTVCLAAQTKEVSIDIRTVIHEIMRIKKRNAAELLSISKIRSNIRIENLDRKQC